MKRVLAIIPAYNEEECLENTIEELKQIAPDVDYIVINDGSKDSTGEICKRNGYPVVTMPVNGGLTVGFQTGMKYAFRHCYDAAVQFDADGQHRPECIHVMADAMEREAVNIVIGSRFVHKKKDMTARMIGSRFITLLIKMTTGHRISDPTSGLRMFDRKMIERYATDPMLNPEPESISFLMRKGAKVYEVPVEMRERAAGESYLNITRSITYMLRACTSILFTQWFRG